MSKLAHSNADTMAIIEANELGVQRENVFPPIPIREFDWAAYEKDYEPGRPVGYGATEAEAIVDLFNQLGE